MGPGRLGGGATGIVVFAASARVGEDVVGVVYLLEAFCASGAFWGVCGDAIGVVFEGSS